MHIALRDSTSLEGVWAYFGRWDDQHDMSYWRNQRFATQIMGNTHILVANVTRGESSHTYPNQLNESVRIPENTGNVFFDKENGPWT